MADNRDTVSGIPRALVTCTDTMRSFENVQDHRPKKNDAGVFLTVSVLLHYLASKTVAEIVMSSSFDENRSLLQCTRYGQP